MPHQDNVKFTFLGHTDDSLGRVAAAQQSLQFNPGFFGLGMSLLEELAEFFVGLFLDILKLADGGDDVRPK